MEGLNPFFQMMDPNVRYVAVVLSVTAGIIASQALITGAFTMVSEATGLNWMPHLQVRYPARTRGQLYIPVINWVLCAATLIVLGIFRDSEHISAAYGLALTITMITTTILLAVYMWYDRKRVLAVVFTIVFLAIQLMFFIASMAKFLHGGWFTMLLTLAILFIMYTWNEGTRLERAQRRHMMPKDFLPALDRLHGDFRIPYFADNIVYLTSDSDMRRLDTDIFFSIFADHQARPCMVGGVGADHRRTVHARVLRAEFRHELPVPSAYPSGIQGVAVYSGVPAPDHARPVGFR